MFHPLIMETQLGPGESALCCCSGLQHTDTGTGTDTDTDTHTHTHTHTLIFPDLETSVPAKSDNKSLLTPAGLFEKNKNQDNGCLIEAVSL